MINRDSIYKIVKSYLPKADDNLIMDLTRDAEREIELYGRELIRKLVLQNTDQSRTATIVEGSCI